VSSTAGRRQRRLDAKQNGNRAGGDTAATRLHAWVQVELGKRVAGLGPGWVGKKIEPPAADPGCYGCGNLGKQRAITMLTRLDAPGKAVRFTLVELCAGCAGNKDKGEEIGEKVFGPAAPTPAPQ
jgi:hypothetical protein